MSKGDRGIFQRPADSGIWWIRYHDENGHEKRRKIGSKSVAKRAYIHQKAEVYRFKALPHERPQEKPARVISISELVDRYASEAKTNLANWKHYERYGRYWRAELGSRLMSEVKPADVEAYKTKRRQVVSPSTINKEVKRLQRLYSLAIRDGLTDRNPVVMVKKFAEPPGRIRYLLDEEEPRLRESFPRSWWPLVEFAFRTGLRQEEQFALKRTQLDFQTGNITLFKTKNRRGRIIPMSDKVRELLLSWLSSQPESLWLFPSRNPATHIAPNNFYKRVFQPSLRRAGISDFVWHDLRHTYASRLVIKGGDLRSIQELMGHASLQQTMKYAHLAPGRLLQVTNLLD